MSEFGTGYAYCLGLFLAHEWRIYESKQRFEKDPFLYSDMASLWFNGAADHLFGLKIPDVLPEEKRKEIDEWQGKCIAFRLCIKGEKCTFEDCFAATQKAKDLLREWDAFHGIENEKGDWE